MTANTTSTIRNARWIADDFFLDALDTEWRTAHEIADDMRLFGTPATLNEVRSRMTEFASYDIIEADGDAWRMPLPQTPCPANDNEAGLKLNMLHHGDCLKLMKSIPDGSVNLLLCDLPYGTCGGRVDGRNIDVPIDLKAFWVEARRILAPHGNVLMFGSQPFTTDLINANREWFKFAMVWRKDKPSGFNHARNKPMKDHEDILWFSPGYTAHARRPGQAGTTENRATYNPWRASEIEKTNNPNRCLNNRYTKDTKRYTGRHVYKGLKNCPRSVLEYAKERGGFHPYQKPVALLDDLIRMFSNPGDLVLDPTAGSGATAIAASKASRDWIAIEQDVGVFQRARERITRAS